MRPYHAREDSLPFSYSPISSVSKSVETTDFYINTERHDNTIKQEQHLKSPQLVRKTLRSPTNSIENTPRYKYNSIHQSNSQSDSNYNKIEGNVGRFSGGGSYKHNVIYGSNAINDYNKTIHPRSKTPNRNEFEELLRERRDKVFNEYQNNDHQPLHHYPPSSKSLSSLTQIKSQKGNTDTRDMNNYDFEFYLSLNEFGNRHSRNISENHKNCHDSDNAKHKMYDIIERNIKSGQTSQCKNFELMTSSNELNKHNDVNLKFYKIKPEDHNQFMNAIVNKNLIKSGNTTQFDYDETINLNKESCIKQNVQVNTTQMPSILTQSARLQDVLPRSETPAFPVTPKVINDVQLLKLNNEYINVKDETDNLNHTSEKIYQTLNNRSSVNTNLSNSEPQEVAPHLVKFAKDSSHFWYKPNLSRDEAISLLLDANPGTFVVRNSTTYKNAFGLVLRVAQMPPYNLSGKLNELVRHFLIEPTMRGVRLKGCVNEPVFTSLSAFVYEHSINRLGLPSLLNIPNCDLAPPFMEPTPAQRQLLTQGAACNVLYLYMCETESLTGKEAIRKTIRSMFAQCNSSDPTEVHFKVTHQGITLTDNTRKKFFRKHHASDLISFCAVDPDNNLWMSVSKSYNENGNGNGNKNNTLNSGGKTIFAFVARRNASSKYNQCHIFCDLDIHQPASAIVAYVNKMIPTETEISYVL